MTRPSADILAEAATYRRLPGDDRIRARLGGMWIDAELLALRAMDPNPDRTWRARKALKNLYSLDQEFHPVGKAGRTWVTSIERAFEGLAREDHG